MMQQRNLISMSCVGLGSAIALFTLAPALAQLTPDQTLGTESSRVTPQHHRDLIEGGAIRGQSLFHSFQDFNVGAGQAVYFANPAAIGTIFTRVTGPNFSSILGTLGVLGTADLFLLNPNGIYFGPNARLDLKGSFHASTADQFIFNTGETFSATDPNAAPLLTVNVAPGVQWNGHTIADIVNEGELIATEGDLSLSGGRVISTGLVAAPDGNVMIQAIAGDGVVSGAIAQTATISATGNLILPSSQLITQGDLTLLAGDTLTVRDTKTSPFLAHAGGNLWVQGNQDIDILALNHLHITPFASFGAMTFVSDGVVSGDAHFTSGGNFNVLDLAGNPGTFLSLYDPIISSAGDVTFSNYSGAALKIEALGSITIDNVSITSPDTALTGTDPDIAILTSYPALILRAGLDTLLNPVTTATTTTFYSTNFNSTVGSEWSDNRTDTTGYGIQFLGRFGTGQSSTTFTFTGLPSHEQLTYSFTLFILGSWDGNGPDFGPDYWSYSVDGTEVLDTTFSSSGNPLNTQNYPTPGSAANAGGVVVDLGEDYSTIYAFRNSIAHTSNTITFSFSSSGLETLDNESWGIGNFSLSNGLLPASTTFNSTSSSSTGNITASNLATANGPIILSARDRISLSDGVESNGGDISLSGAEIDIDGAIVRSRGGDIAVTSSGDLALSNNTALISEAGTISLSGTDIDLTNNVGLQSTTGAVSVQGSGALTLNKVAVQTQSGNIALDGATVALTEADFDSTSGTIALDSSGALTLQTATFDSQNNINLDGATVALTEANLESANGAIVIDSDSTLTLDTTRVGSVVSDVTLNSQGDLTVNRSLVGSRGGAVTVQTPADISVTNTLIGLRVNTTSATGALTVSGNTITLEQQGQLVTQADGAADAAPINVTANRLVMRTNGSIGALSNSSGRGGDVTVTVDQLFMIDNPTQIGTRAQKSGAGGNLTVNARTVEILRGANVGSNTSGDSTGAGGSTVVNASESIVLDGGDPADYVPNPQNLSQVLNDIDTGMSTFTRGSGQAGELRVNTPRLDIRNSAGLTVATLADGDAGVLTVNADTVQIEGRGGLASFSLAGGDAGDIRLTAKTVNVDRGAVISADSLQAGDGGNLTVTADTLTVRQGARIGAATTGAGQGGTITLNTQALEVTGRTSDRTVASAITASTAGAGNAGQITMNGEQITIANGAEVSSSTSGRGDAGRIMLQSRGGIEVNNASIAASVGANATGNGGTISLTAPNITLANGATVSSSSQGQGVAGNINTEGDRLRLSDRAAIRAETSQGDGGNINIISNLWVILRNNANISTTAGTAASGGNGGNIRIATGFLLGVPIENSDITANAFTGNGGQIDIEATQIYGFSTLGYLTRFSDITASSEFGAAGIIALDTNFDAAQGVNELPTDLSDRTDQIFDACSVVGQDRFTITGRGGVSEFLQPTLNNSEDWQDTRTITPGLFPQPLTLDPSATVPLPPTFFSLRRGSGCGTSAQSL
ncbi:filamentous hemagglutinin N-terminal domain-containing protein [Spirulina major]|uniref:two-partner secretion domain-containing protein n=1 Tax=Spirulina major TaxID=270636 RepID=UPI0015870DEC|nr:filamentous hemagglutinin N-terminal domain-containing protein [Spirulina major]